MMQYQPLYGKKIRITQFVYRINEDPVLLKKQGGQSISPLQLRNLCDK